MSPSIISRATVNDRTSPEFWNHEAAEFQKYAKVPLAHFIRYAARYAGNGIDIPFATQDGSADGVNAPATYRPMLANLTNLAARRMVASLYYRNPTFYVAPPAMERDVFTPALAKIETTRLNNFAKRSNLYGQMREMLLDGALAPYFVGKMWYSCDVAIDPVAANEAYEAAVMENALFAASGGRIAPRVKQDDGHESHIKSHREWIASAERGEMDIPRKYLNYMRKHVEKHEEALPESRATETTRDSAVNFIRVNPRDFAFDPWDKNAVSWERQHYIARLEDVLGNDDFSREARAQVAEAQGTHFTADEMPEVYGAVPLRTRDQHVHMFEVMDYVESQVITYADGCTSKPLVVRPWSMGDLLPSGPYIRGSFMKDPMNGFGVCMPYIYEAHQDEMSLLEGVNNRTVELGGPKIGYDSSALDPETAEKAASFGLGDTVPFKHLRDGQKIADVFQQLDSLEPKPGAVMQSERNHRWFEILSGFGSVNLGGGDHANTATASDLVNEAGSALMDDMASEVDHISTVIGRYFTRYTRALDSQETVRQEVGNDAIQPGGWPATGFAKDDIRNDRGVGVVPGSSRRNTSSIRTKQIQEGLAMFLQSPLAMTSPDIAINLFEKYFQSVDIYDIDWQGATDAMAQAQLSQVAAQELGNDPNAALGQAPQPPKPGGGPPQPNQGVGPPNREGQQQGRQNAAGGGGRVPTGAGEGDNPRPNRRGPPAR